MGRLVIGLLVGVAVGWGAARLGDRDAAGRLAAPSGRGAPAPDAAGEPGAEPASAPAPEAPDPLALLADGTAADIRRDLLGDDAQAAADDAWTAVLAARLPKARAARDWALFKALLEAAARVGSDDAHALLLSVMGDATLEFPERMGKFFAAALKDADLPGIAAAARRRIERNVEDGETSWVGVDGWAELVAARGDRGDCEWLLDRSESGQFASFSRMALSASANPAAVELVVPRLRARFGVEGRSRDVFDDRCLQAFARANPERALDLIEEFVLDAARAVAVDDATARTLGDLATSANEDRVRRVLASARDDADRLALCYALPRMARNGLDPSGLERLVEAPVALLERFASGGATDRERNLASRARYAIEYNRPLWSARAAAALEAAGFQEEAAKVRAGLASAWIRD